MRTDPGVREARGVADNQSLPGRHFKDGVSQSGREPNRLFLSYAREGGAGGRQFIDASGLSGMDDRADGRAFAWLDFDRDGWQDVAVVNANAPLLQLFRNELGRGPAPVLSFLLRGANHTAQPVAGASNRDGIGARVEVTAGGTTQVRELRAGEGLAAQNAGRLLFGLGDHAGPASARVVWPSGRVQTLDGLRPGEEWTVYEDAGRTPVRSAYARPPQPTPPRADDPPAPRLLADLDDDAPLRVLTTLATWCEACREELPELRALRERFPPEELALYGVPVDEDESPEQVERWARRHRPPYRVLSQIDRARAEAVRAAAAAALRRDALPASVITDGEGRVLRTLAGAPSVSDLRALAGGVAR
ncbi:MAG: ASPIC/UnbV domain-containing protein [Myxococcota bacterium]